MNSKKHFTSNPHDLAQKAYDLKNTNPDESLKLIDNALEISPLADFFLIKAIVLLYLNEIEKSQTNFIKSLKFEMGAVDSKDLLISEYVDKCDNMGCLEEVYDRVNSLEENMNILSLKGNILDRLKRHVEAWRCFYRACYPPQKLEEFEKQIEFIKNSSDVLINVTGVGYYEGYRPFTEGVMLCLKKDPLNKYDSNAIGVFIDGVKVGNVANSSSTVVDGVKSADEIHGLFIDECRAEFLFLYMETNFIARLII